MRKVKTIINHIDLSKHITCHLIGDNHTHVHRKLIDTIIIIVGIGCAKIAAFINISIFNFAIEAIGYSLHGIGLIPFTQSIEDKKKQESINKELLNN